MEVDRRPVPPHSPGSAHSWQEYLAGTLLSKSLGCSRLSASRPVACLAVALGVWTAAVAEERLPWAHRPGSRRDPVRRDSQPVQSPRVGWETDSLAPWPLVLNSGLCQPSSACQWGSLTLGLRWATRQQESPCPIPDPNHSAHGPRCVLAQPPSLTGTNESGVTTTQDVAVLTLPRSGKFHEHRNTWKVDRDV